MSITVNITSARGIGTASGAEIYVSGVENKICNALLAVHIDCVKVLPGVTWKNLCCAVRLGRVS